MILDGRISRVQFGTLAFLCRSSQTGCGLSAGSHTPRLRWFIRSLVPPQAYGLFTGSESGHHAAGGTAKRPEPLCPIPGVTESWGDMDCLLGGHYSSVIARTGSCVSPVDSPLLRL